MTADTANQITLHEGDLVIYTLPQYRNGIWQYRIRLPDGDYERKTTKLKDLRDATRFAEDRYQEIKFRAQRNLSLNGYSFEKAANEYIVNEERQFGLDRRTKRTTLDRNLGIVRTSMIPYFKGRALAEITIKDIDAYHVWHHDNWKRQQHKKNVIHRTCDNRGKVYATPLRVEIPGSMKREPRIGAVVGAQRLLIDIFDLAVRNGHVTQSECPVITRVKKTIKQRGAFTADEVITLFGRLESRISEPDIGTHRAARRLLFLYCRFLLLTGIRPGSECHLRFRDIVYKDGNQAHVVVYVRDGKTGPRQVLVSDELRAVIEDIKAQHPDPAPDAMLWIKPNGEVTEYFAQQFTSVLKELHMEIDADGNARTLYSLRHTYITRCLERGVNHHFLAKNCGNSVVVIEKTYNHVLHQNMVSEIFK